MTETSYPLEDRAICLFIHLIKFLTDTFHVAGTVLGTKIASANKIGKIPLSSSYVVNSSIFPAYVSSL